MVNYGKTAEPRELTKADGGDMKKKIAAFQQDAASLVAGIYTAQLCMA